MKKESMIASEVRQIKKADGFADDLKDAEVDASSLRSPDFVVMMKTQIAEVNREEQRKLEEKAKQVASKD